MPKHDYFIKKYNINHFCEWGGDAWSRLTHKGISNYLASSSLENIKVLEIGFRSGKMSVLFALLGANVVAVDINEKCIKEAYREAELYHVNDKIKFIHTDMFLETIQENGFDLVFCKSVLTVSSDFEKMLKSIHSKLNHTGKIIFIENSYGNSFLHLARRFRHKSNNYKNWNYLKSSHIKLIEKYFTIESINKSHIPPIYLINGIKKIV